MSEFGAPHRLATTGSGERWQTVLDAAARTCARHIVREGGGAEDLRELLSVLGLTSDTPLITRPSDPGAASATLQGGEPA